MSACGSNNSADNTSSTSVKKNENFIFVELLSKYKIILQKTTSNIHKQKQDAARNALTKEYNEKCQTNLTIKQILKKLNNMKNKLKDKNFKNISRSKQLRYQEYEKMFLNLWAGNSISIKTIDKCELLRKLHHFLRMSKRKIKVFSLSDKLKIVNAFEGGKSQNEIRSEFALPQSSFYKIIKYKDSIKLRCSEGQGNIKRSRVVEFPDVEKCLVEWIKQTLDKSIPIDGPLLKEKSKNFARKLGIQNFSASNGWLEGFKKRHDLAFKKTTRGSKSADQGMCSQWTKDLPSLLGGYKPGKLFDIQTESRNKPPEEIPPVDIIEFKTEAVEQILPDDIVMKSEADCDSLKDGPCTFSETSTHNWEPQSESEPEISVNETENDRYRKMSMDDLKRGVLISQMKALKAQEDAARAYEKVKIYELSLLQQK